MFPKELRQSLILVWPLLAGLWMIMIGNGLQGTLLGLRADAEGFSVEIIGVIMSLYYVGFLAGCHLTPIFISSVGHVRVFAALASIASTTILVNGMLIDEWIWGFMRIISGMSFAGLFIVSESWLNNIATNKLRGQIFGSYLFSIHSGLFIGQFLINLGSIQFMDHFVIVSILVSLSFLPLTLANKPAPGYEEPEKLPFRKLIKQSQLAVLGVAASGFCAGAVFGLGPVYGTKIGLNSYEIAMFLGAYVLGSGTIPLALGWMSDRIDRRRMINGIALISALTALMFNTLPALYTLSILFGGLIASLYSVSIAYMNDQVSPKQMVSASSSMILFNGMGAAASPIIAGILIGAIGTSSFFYLLAFTLTLTFAFGVYRDYAGEEIAVEEQGEFIHMPIRSAITPLDITEDD